MMMMFKEKERRIVKVNFCLQKQDREQEISRSKTERKKERKKERNATHRELLGRCRANVDARRRRHDER
tara:strand:+ start:1678 stop:1884 length:207 start_codon:yes stop_codon:yes gene_type:complete